MSEEILLKQGAEGRIFVGDFNGEKCLVKERFVKKYRHPDLDSQISKERIKAESKAITRCQTAGILTPKILHMDLNDRKLYIQYFEDSISIKDYINQEIFNLENYTSVEELCSEIGLIIGKLHTNNIIHGDLTTSNILLNPKSTNSKNSLIEYDIILIDFGLSHYSQNLEDKGVDLYVLERALISTHSNLPDLFNWIINSYKKGVGEQSKDIINKFEEVRARGRKRTMIG